MAANTTPIFAATPRCSFLTTGTAANTNLDGTGTVATVFTAGTNGSRVDQISIYNMGTNAATVLRLFINNGSSNTTAANNALVYEITIASNTVSQTVSSIPYLIYPNFILPAGYKINATIGTVSSDSGFMVACFGGDF